MAIIPSLNDRQEHETYYYDANFILHYFTAKQKKILLYVNKHYANTPFPAKQFLLKNRNDHLRKI